MSRFHPQAVCLSLVLVALLAACGKEEVTASRPVGDDDSLPRACVEAEAAQRACTEAMAAGYERAGQGAAAKTLRDAIPGEMDKTRARWRSVSDKNGLTRACEAMRDGIRAQPQCNKG